MAKRKRENTPDIVERRIKEGRGTGRGGHYKPWLLVQDVIDRIWLCPLIVDGGSTTPWRFAIARKNSDSITII
jgi:hypothetical protein